MPHKPAFSLIESIGVRAMTPAYLAARVEVRERRALSEYRTARSIWFYRPWTSPEIANQVLVRALIARAVWSQLHDLQREPETTTDSSLLNWASALLTGDAQ